MKIDSFPKNKASYSDYADHLKFKSSGDIKTGLTVFDPTYSYRKTRLSEFKPSTWVLDKVDRFEENLLITHQLRRSVGNVLLEPDGVFDMMFVESGYSMPFLDAEDEDFVLREIEGIIVTTVRNSFLVIEVEAHENEVSGVKFRDSIGLFYPRIEYSDEIKYVPSMYDVLAYLDYIGASREKCKFTFVEFSGYENQENEIPVMDKLDYRARNNYNNNLIENSEGEIEFNLYKSYIHPYQSKPFGGESWEDSIGKEAKQILEIYSPDIADVENAKLSVTISF